LNVLGKLEFMGGVTTANVLSEGTQAGPVVFKSGTKAVAEEPRVT